jgi:hypothetical protein
MMQVRELGKVDLATRRLLIKDFMVKVTLGTRLMASINRPRPRKTRKQTAAEAK